MQRNQTLSSTSGNESDDNKPKPQTIIKKDNSQISKTTKDKKEPLQTSKLEISRDIFDDLFAKSEILQKKDGKEKQKVANIKENVLDKKVDLFNDNLFDDIDDIFTNNVVKNKVSKQSKEGNANKTLFDESDDLFADIAVTKTSFTEEIKNNLDKSNTKSIFGSDDDLFTDKPVVQAEKKEVYLAKTSITKGNLKDTSLFDSDDDDDNIFSSKSKTDSKKKQEKNQNTNDHKDMLKEDLDNDLFTNLTETQTQGKISSEIKPSMSSHLANDNELFTSTSKNIDDYNDSFRKDDEKSQGALSSLKDSEKASIGNKTSEDEVLQTQQDAENPTKDTTMFSKTNYVQKSNDDIFTKNIVQDVEDTVDTKECKNSAIKHSKSKQFKVDDTFSDIMDEDDGDIFSNDKDKPQIKDTSIFNIENTSEIQDKILNDESENDLFKTKNVGTDVIKDVTKDKMKPTVSQKSISKTPNTAETVHCSKTNSTQKTTVNTKSNTIKSEINKNTTHNNTNLFDSVSNLAEKGKPDNMKDVDRNKNLTVVDNVLRDETISHSDTLPVFETRKNTFDDIFNEASKHERDLFSDIFIDQPPIFEKPKEPKKSQNVNALFDDDSDDEALFFKKNDVILHDHPEEFSPDISGDRFDIFHDEPPAIDIVQETTESVSKQDSGIIFKHKVIEANTTNINENLFESRQHVIVKGDNEKSKNNINDLQNVFNDELYILPAELKTQKTDEMKPNIDKTDGVPNEPKRIGKLRPMNFNINVNTLLPGASPKKVQQIEQTDEQTIPTKNNEDLQTNEVSEQDGTKLVKSVSFESEPDSTILDNKLSKERVKIQVKRRPSTRRARREAVKKSGIDFGEDSTDNSNSIDDHVKESKIEAEEESDVIVSEKINVSEQDNLQKSDGDVKSMKASINTATSKDFAISEDTDTSKDLKTVQNLFSKGNTLENVTSSPIRDVKSKVVYILNDEDIFNSNPQVVSKMDAEVTKVDSVKVTEPTNVTLANLDNEADLNVVTKTQSEATKTKQILNIVNDEDDDDIFKSMVTKSESKTNIQPVTIKPSIKKLETALNSDSDDDIFKDFTNVKKMESTLKNESTSTKLLKPEQKGIFGDLSDEDNELFNKNNKGFKASNNKIFGSDSDEELFGKKKDKKREVKENKIEVKGTLFGDDDNDELFSSKEKKNAGKSNCKS